MSKDFEKGMDLAASAAANLNAQVAVSIDVNQRAAAAAKQAAADYKKWADIMAKDDAAALTRLLQGLAELEARMLALRAVVPLDVQAGIDASDSAQVWELAQSFIGLGEEIGITSTAITDFKSHMDSLPKQTKLEFDAEQLKIAQKHAEELDQTYDALSKTLHIVGASMDNAFGSAVQGIADIIDAIVAEIQALHALEAAAWSANAALGLIGIGFMVGNWIARHVRGGATGGLVTPSGIQQFTSGGMVWPMFQPTGTDTVPAMLSPGEVILNAAQQRRLVGAMSHGDTHVHNWAGVIMTPDIWPIVARNIARHQSTNLAQNKASAFTRSRAGLGLRS
jgi:hypothetical protein